MCRFLIWGTGRMASEFYDLFSKIDVLRNYEIVCFIDNDFRKWNGTFKGKPIIKPSEISEVQYDYICIWTAKYEAEIIRQLTEDMNIAHSKVVDIFFQYKQSIHKKYENCDDLEIQDMLERIDKTKGLDVYYFDSDDRRELKEVFYDPTADLYYIFFEGKRLYLKRNYEYFLERNGKKYANDMWGEQHPNSPHLYEKGNITVEQGDILVDAGVCEGNFSLHNIDKVKKVYLIECDEAWMEALHYTFYPYKDKVIFCNKFLSNSDSANTVCLDTLVIDNTVDFIKMDIEGEEVNALKGANRILCENHSLKCAICSYHRHDDEQNIKQILENYGLRTEVSKGYMLFLYDNYVLQNPELRRGIVRGIKR